MIYTKELLKNEVVPGYAFDCYFGRRKVGILDIETTGLSPDRTRVILGGLITIEPGRDTVLAEEFFCEYNNDRDEKELLEVYMAAIRNVDVVVTYNGEHFDIPFLRTRCKKLGVEFEEGLPYNLDLYRVLKKYSEIKKVLPNMKQKTVESYFGLWKTRTDMITGKDSVDLYYAFLAHKPGEGREAVKSTIILHNSDDCAQLHRLLPILAKADIHRAAAGLGFPAGERLCISGISVEKSTLRIAGRQRREPIDYRAFAGPSEPLDVRFDAKRREFTVEVPLTRAGGKGVTGADGVAVPELLLADAVALGVDISSIEVLPGIEKGYIIVKKGGEINYSAVNAFARLILEKLEGQLWSK